ncbi:hypothetical protein CLOP_g4860 [Closterium sp. NIES-67]|nr:hypothetical protein CLOP_g4860 [Closterium sp. NIES-67]
MDRLTPSTLPYPSLFFPWLSNPQHATPATGVTGGIGGLSAAASLPPFDSLHHHHHDGTGGGGGGFASFLSLDPSTSNATSFLAAATSAASSAATYAANFSAEVATDAAAAAINAVSRGNFSDPSSSASLSPFPTLSSAILGPPAPPPAPPPEFVDSFCRPQFNGSWESITNELGAFTPCFIDIVVLGTAYLAMILLAVLRLYVLYSTPRSQQRVVAPGWRGQRGIVVAAALAMTCAVVPLMQLSARVSLSSFSKDVDLPPYEVCSLILSFLAWTLTSTALFWERQRMAVKGAWLLRFACCMYVMVGQLAKLRFVLILQNDFQTFFVELFFGYTSAHVLLGLLALFFFPTLLPREHPSPGFSSSSLAAAEAEAGPLLLPASHAAAVGNGAAEYAPLAAGPVDGAEGEGEEEEGGGDRGQVCPEDHASFINRLTFGWMTPLMATGYRRPLEDSDVWRLNDGDRTAAVYGRFEREWREEKGRPKPWLLRALHSCFGRRFWWGGFCKIGNDASQFVGPLMLNRLLSAMQSDEPAWHGYVYATVIFLGLVGGVICEAQYFQAVMRVGFQLRQAMVAAVFSKSLRLSHSGRQGFSTGRITNMMTNDAESLQMICQQLHGLWSAPLRILVCIFLLYQQLGVASLLGLLMLLLMIPAQAVIVNRVQKLVKASLQRSDKRVALMSEVLAAMDVVKSYTWEESFQGKVARVRGDEMGQISKAQYIMAINFLLMSVVPVLVTVVSFGCYSLLGHQLTAAKAFTSISLFAVLRFPLYMFPNLITQVVNVNVSLTRLQEMLLADETDIDAPAPAIDPSKPAVEVSHASFAWGAAPSAAANGATPAANAPGAGAGAGAGGGGGAGGVGGAAGVGDGKEKVGSGGEGKQSGTLTDVTLSVEPGKLVAVVGATGQGKSSLVSALLGEMPMVSGDSPPIIRGRVAYVSQVSWIFNATVRDNILFGLPYDRQRYERAVQVSALERDLELLPGGDLTEIGERGVNVSGGQKQRISIARAVYSNADVFFFDDPLSALDAHVAKQVYDTCVRTELAGRTRIMVTNQLHFLPAVDWVVMVENGRIAEQGPYDQLRSSAPKFQRLLEKAGALEDHGEGEVGGGGDEKAGDVGSSGSETNAEAAAAAATAGSTSSSSADGATAAAGGSSEGKKGGAVGGVKAGTKLVQTEERERGVVSPAVVWRYVRAMGGPSILAVLISLYVLVEAARVLASVWISIWTGSVSKEGEGGGSGASSSVYFVAVYSLISLGQVMLTFANQYFLVFSSQRAARRLHDAMLAAILRAPMSFFHTNPVGRLINRFTKDTADIDKNLAQYTSLCLGGIFQLLSTFALIGVLNTVALWAIVPLLLLFYVVYLYFQNTAREVKRWDSVTRSPVYSQFAEALNGLATIRAYRAAPRMAAMNGWAVDRNTRFTLVSMSANRWLAIRLEFLGGLMIFATAVFAVMDVQRAGDQAALAPVMGLILSYALQITAMMTMVLRLLSVAENSFNAVERVGSYADIPPEAPAIIPSHRPPPGWPKQGEVSFEDVVMRYRPDLPPVLRGLSALVQGGEKVGVVGRTGAGKSSLFNSLFRLVEIESGRICIDGQDLKLFGVTDVRRALMIIPQTPVLFTGTLRFNLDPFNERSDNEVWEALGRAHLREVVSRMPLGLDTEVAEGGENFSVGQRQLISLARALLKESRILVLDEATAAVDVGTDALIQRTVREEFKGRTMLTIAHRLNTIMDSDRILVMDAGMALEYDTPANLVLNEQSVFAAMVRSTGPQTAKYLRSVALGEVALEDELAGRAAAEEKKMAREAAKWRWATAAQWALALTLTSSQRDLQAMCSDSEGEDGEREALVGTALAQTPSFQRGVLEETRDATQVLHAVLSGQRSEEISAALTGRQLSEEKWWTAVSRVAQGLALMAKQVQAKLEADGSLRDSASSAGAAVGGRWAQLAATGEEMAGGSVV